MFVGLETGVLKTTAGERKYWCVSSRKEKDRDVINDLRSW